MLPIKGNEAERSRAKWKKGPEKGSPLLSFATNAEPPKRGTQDEREKGYAGQEVERTHGGGDK